jgi:hypothetical protein
MIKVRCKCCNKELEAEENQTRCCGCPNMTTISNEIISAVDLSKVVMLNSYQSKTKTKIKTNVLTDEDIQWQEERRRRKVKRLDFEVR